VRAAMASALAFEEGDERGTDRAASEQADPHRESFTVARLSGEQPWPNEFGRDAANAPASVMMAVCDEQDHHRLTEPRWIDPGPEPGADPVADHHRGDSDQEQFALVGPVDTADEEESEGDDTGTGERRRDRGPEHRGSEMACVQRHDQRRTVGGERGVQHPADGAGHRIDCS